MLCPNFVLFTINYESTHKIPKVKWDLIIIDEAHSMGAFPSLAVEQKKLRHNTQAKTICYLDVRTPTLESYRRCTTKYMLFPKTSFGYANFYRFANDYVNKKESI